MTQETVSQRARDREKAYNRAMILEADATGATTPGYARRAALRAMEAWERSILSEHSDGVVTCPICGDDNSPCKVCNGHGFLTTEEAAGWLLAQRDVSEHDSRVKELEALLAECCTILKAAARPGERPSLLVRVEAALNGGSDAGE